MTNPLTITGDVYDNSTLTANFAIPDGATVTYQWSESAVRLGTYTDIVGATGSTEPLDVSLYGNHIEVTATVTYADDSTASFTSAPTAAVRYPLADTPVVTITGNQTPSSRLIASVTDANPTESYQYQWLISTDMGATWNFLLKQTFPGIDAPGVGDELEVTVRDTKHSDLTAVSAPVLIQAMASMGVSGSSGLFVPHVPQAALTPILAVR